LKVEIQTKNLKSKTMKPTFAVIVLFSIIYIAAAGSDFYISSLPPCPLCQDVYEGAAEAFPSPNIYPPPCDGLDRVVYFVMYLRKGVVSVRSGSCAGHVKFTRSSINEKFEIEPLGSSN
jgi:hypothetical protein